MQMDETQTVVISGDDELEVVIVDENGNAEMVTDNDDESEAKIEAVEVVADSAVLIAEIEAEKEIEIAGIEAAVSIAAIEANSENESDDKWQMILNQLENQALAMVEMQSQVSLLSEHLLTRPPLPETETTELNSIKTEVPDKSADEKPEAEPEAPKRRIRAI